MSAEQRRVHHAASVYQRGASHAVAADAQVHAKPGRRKGRPRCGQRPLDQAPRRGEPRFYGLRAHRLERIRAHQSRPVLTQRLGPVEQVGAHRAALYQSHDAGGIIVRVAQRSLGFGQVRLALDVRIAQGRRC